ncbi:thioredoxin [candidate division LCP-89 bacterium B3_LCP]|uniref:Thioredoxin n=1 Tax=candidate division LCP-89 bacterium B3_LCP TaxID=2012998 RepID=A0A532UZ81_UNCL8|nr:MAG: thioredoxin [candidate division LCP-89 bacterium B3_LCP]
MAEVLKINDDQFENEVIECDRLVVVDFGAEWCGPCKKLHPIMAELAEEMADKAKIVEVDVGLSPQSAQKHAVISVPQVLFFKEGKVVERIVGVLPKAKLIEKIDTHI